jgi:hypothetical protein
MIGRGLMEYVVNAKRDERVYICQRNFAVFAMYYFAEYFTYAIPDFQWKMYKELNELSEGKFKYLIWIMFRESSKTTIAKMYLTYCICYRKKRFINYDSYDKANSEAALFDIVTWLQSNRRLIADFGQLYHESIVHSSKEAKMKRISEFVTANKVKVKAYSTQESTRGRIYDRWRPDLFCVDDYETEMTAKSVPVTAKIIAHLDTMKTGMSVDGQALFLCNLITETGSVASLMNEAKENPGSWRMHRVDVESEGKIAWPDKYVETEAEASKINAGITDRKNYKVSLEQKKKDLNSGGRKVYEAEMLNSPEAAGEPFFNRERVDKYMALGIKKKPIKIVGGFSIWEEFVARNRYAIGGDTAKGVGRDSCASVAIRFAPTDQKASMVIGTYASNTIPPDLFGDEMAAHGRLFGECLVAPEQNATGFATVTRLKAIYPVHQIYRRVEEDQLGKKITKDLGWEARPGGVEAIYFNFRSAFDGGDLEIYSLPLLAEMRMFTRRDLESSAKRVEQADGAGLVTRHFDLLRAACIAWEMRTHARAKLAVKYKQKDVERVSEYQG